MVSESANPRSRPRPHLLARQPATFAAWLAPAVLAGCGLALVYAVDPRTPGNYPPCLFLFVTGCYCPGCGTLRALHSLLHGDLSGALGYNALTIALLPFLGAAYCHGLAHAVGRRPIPALRVSHHAAWATLAVVLAFWAMRNVPVSPLSALAP